MKTPAGFIIAFAFTFFTIVAPASSQITVHGIITDSASGQPVANAKVYIINRNENTAPYYSTTRDTLFGDTTLTNTSGVYSITATPTDTNHTSLYGGISLISSLIIRVKANGYEEPAADSSWNFPLPSDVNQNVLISRAAYGGPNVSIQGTVRNGSAGSPLAGVYVTLSTIHSTTTWGGISTTHEDVMSSITTLTDGKFAFKTQLLASGSKIRVHLSKSGYVGFDTMLTYSALLPLPVTLAVSLDRDFATITGTITNKSTGAAIPQAKVFLHELVYSTIKPDSCLGYYAKASTVAGANGAYILDSIAPYRSYRIVAVQSGFAPDSAFADFRGVVSGNPTVTRPISLRPAIASLSGVVCDSFTRRPLKGVTVFLMGEKAVKIGQIWRFLDTLLDSSVTLADGTYRLDSIPDTTYHFIRITIDGYYPVQKMEFEFQGGISLVHNFFMVMQSGLYGRVSDSVSRQAVRNAAVVLTTRFQRPGPIGGWLTIVVDSMMTDSTGRYAFALGYAGYSTASLTLNTGATGYVTKSQGVTVDSVPAILNIRLRPISTAVAMVMGESNVPVLRIRHTSVVLATRGTATARLHTLSGRMVYQTTFTNTTVLDCTRWSASPLLLELKNDNGTICKKLWFGALRPSLGD